MQPNIMHGCMMFGMGWRDRPADTPPFVRGEVVRALFVPTMPRTRPKSLPRDVRLIDAATLLAVVGGEPE